MKGRMIVPALALALVLGGTGTASAVTFKGLHGGPFGGFAVHAMAKKPVLLTQIGPSGWKGRVDLTRGKSGKGPFLAALLGKHKGGPGYGHGGKPPKHEVAPIPVPAALPLLAAGLGLMGFVARRRREAVAPAA